MLRTGHPGGTRNIPAGSRQGCRRSQKSLRKMSDRENGCLRMDSQRTIEAAIEEEERANQSIAQHPGP